MATETVRFSRVVQQSGQPETYTLWVKPDQDKAFAALLRQDRVLTVHQETAGAKADYGLVGYTEDRHRSLLVFPKSLKMFAGKRIIGIKYDELKGMSSSDSAPAPPPKKGVASKKHFPPPKIHKPARAEVREKKPVSPPQNQIPFPKPEVVRFEKPEKAEEPEKVAKEPEKMVTEDSADELSRLKKAVEKALEALAKDKPVTAFNGLKEAVREK